MSEVTIRTIADRAAIVALVRTMGTVVSVEVRGADPSARLDAAIDSVAARLDAVDAAFSTWRPTSWVSRLMRAEVSLDECPTDARHVIALAEQARALTNGYFSPRWRGPAGPDPTGLVKGWAAQQASDLLLAHGLPDHVVNAAGDLVVSGYPEPGTTAPWRVGISDPQVPGDLVGVVELPSGGRKAMATSGMAELGSHVVDPHDGRAPSDVAAATTVVRLGPACTEAGALTDATATALVAAGAHACSLMTALRSRDLEALLVHHDGRISDPDSLLLA